MKDYVVLVDEKNHPIGTMEKLAAHNKNTPVHRGFSLFLFNKNGELLLQQRSGKKKTWPLVWSNSVCGHPMIDEAPTDAAQRRLAFELGIKKAEIIMMLPDYRYRCEKDGVVENEFCPVMIGISEEKGHLNPDEVEAVKWIPWEEWLAEVKARPDDYSPWCVEETILLSEKKDFLTFLKRLKS